MTIRRKTNGEIVLRALLQGHAVHIPSFVTLKLEDTGTRREVCAVVTRISNGETSDAYLPLDLKLDHFLSLCDTIPDSDIIDIVARLARP